MADSTSPDAPRQDPPRPSRPSLAQRLQPWVDMLYKLLAALATAVALWKGLG